MATATKSPNSDLGPGRNPGQDEFDKLNERFNPDHKDNKPAGDASDPRGGDKADAKEQQKSGSTTGSAATSGEAKSLYSKSPSVKKRGFTRGPKGNLKKKATMTVLVFIASVAASIAIFFALLPLKILHVVQNLQNHFYSSTNSAMENETQSLFNQYVVNHVLPSYKSCGTTISKDCSVNVLGTNPVTNLYHAWGNARIENKLAKDYGIEFQRKPDGWYLKAPGIAGDGVNIGQDGAGLDNAFKKVGYEDIHKAVKDETQWYQVYFRFKVGRLLEEKYGIRRCIIFCGLTDPLANKIADQKIAAKLYLVQRVITPRTQSLGIVLECLFTNCGATKTEPTEAVDGENAALAGAPENAATDTALRDGLEKLAAKYGASNIDTLVALYADISEKGFQNYLITEGLSVVLPDALSARIADAIPIAGWINLATQVINAANDSSGTLKKLGYITNAAAAVDLFSMYRTYADEIKTGHVTATEVGSMVDSLGPGNSGASTDTELGGTAGAEATPLYSSLIDGRTIAPTPAATASLLSDLFSNKVYAAATNANGTPYVCNDGKPVSAGKQVCDEEVLGEGNNAANLIHGFLNSPGADVFTKFAEIWSSSIGKIFTFIGDLTGPIFSGIISLANAACSVPLAGDLATGGYCTAKSEAQKLLPDIENAVTQWLIPDPFSSNMSGGRTFDMMAAGADVSGNDSAHTTLGGQALTPQQSATIINQQQQEAQQEFNHQPLFAKIFSTDSQYSVVTRLAMAMPSNTTEARTDIANIFFDPLGKLASVFGSIFTAGHVFAASPAQPDPFGVVQYGYPDGTIPADPNTYWDQNCSNNASNAYQNSAANNAWNVAASQTLDPATEMPVNNKTNPCLLIMAATGSDGAIYAPSLLTPDDLGTASTPAGTTPTPTPTPTPVAGSAQTLANKILGDNNIQLTGRDVLQDIQDAANGVPGTAGAMTSAALLQLILDVAQSHTVTISAIQSGGTGHCNNTGQSACPGDPHYNGDAVDFSSLDGVALTGRNAGSLTIMQIAFTVLPSGSGFGQSECGTTPPLPAGDTTFNDTCDHLHVQVPAGTP